jgi:hypothetical protein
MSQVLKAQENKQLKLRKRKIAKKLKEQNEKKENVCLFLQIIFASFFVHTLLIFVHRINDSKLNRLF